MSELRLNPKCYFQLDEDGGLNLFDGHCDVWFPADEVEALKKFLADESPKSLDIPVMRNQFAALLHNWLTLDHVTEIMTDFDKIFSEPINPSPAPLHDVTPREVRPMKLFATAEYCYSECPELAAFEVRDESGGLVADSDLDGKQAEELAYRINAFEPLDQSPSSEEIE